MKKPYPLLPVIIAIAATAILISSCKNKKAPPKENRNELVENVSLGKTPASFLFLSDIHLETYSDTTVPNHDTGMDLWYRFLSKAESLLSAPDAPQFIIYTGDLPGHYGKYYLQPNSPDRIHHDRNIDTILTGLRNLATKYNKALFYLPGNNDGLAGDYYSFTDENGNTPFYLVPDSSNPYPALNINRSGNKAPCIVSNPRPDLGYYAAKPVEGLRLLALNTVMYNHGFKMANGSDPDSARHEQMKWLEAQLADATAKKEKVYIAMHIPPGLDAFGTSQKSKTVLMWQGQKWQNKFLRLTSDPAYQQTIAGILYGHTHMDELRLLYDSSGQQVTEVAISCPGVTTEFGHNSGFKTVQYDPSSKELVDFTTYYTKLGVPWGNDQYRFSQVFNAAGGSTIYQCLKTMSISNVVANMDSIFTVKKGPASYDIQPGIKVLWSQ
ncbi:MAG: hypothetical protein HOP10_04935 [Chitinophagaceae bacterium]|nr:hypothetical protein [Chitinophagaceae bacterium]